MTPTERKLNEARQLLRNAKQLKWGSKGIAEIRAKIDALEYAVEFERKAARAVKHPAGALFDGVANAKRGRVSMQDLKKEINGGD